MTSHYLDIQLRPDPEVAPHQMMGNLYGRLHRALAQLGRKDIGVSFPGHDDNRPSLGTQLRLHGPDEALLALNESRWLYGLQDHLHVGAVTKTPVTAQHRVVSRVQAKSSAERMRRRAMKRHGLSHDQAAERIPFSAEVRLRLPFATVSSQSTNQSSFPLFIRHGPLRESACDGGFNTYGLSHQSTVPWF